MTEGLCIGVMAADGVMVALAWPPHRHPHPHLTDFFYPASGVTVAVWPRGRAAGKLHHAWELTVSLARDRTSIQGF